jgi:hypothetical protein
MNVRAISSLAASALVFGSILAAPAQAGSRDHGGWPGGHGGWHHHHRHHHRVFGHYGLYQPVFYGHGSFASCRWVKTWKGFIKVCDGISY